MKYALLFTLLINSTTTTNMEFISKKKVYCSSEPLERVKLYNKMIEFIKKSEGLILHKYYCPSGQPTIGYGHLILKSESFPDSITEAFADSLVRVDFDQRMDQTDKSLEYHKRLAIAHFIFNCGIGKYKGSLLEQTVISKKPIDKVIIRYCYYKSKGVYVRSNYLLKSRIYELKLYNYEW